MPRLRSARRAPSPSPRAPWLSRPVPLAGAAAVALALSLSAASCAAPGQGGRAAAADPAAELVLQPVADQGPDPFTESTATSDGAAPSPAPTAAPPGGTPPAQPGEQESVTGSTAGLYGGTRAVASCDVGKQADFLDRNADKRRAFARTLRVREADLRSYLRGLTPVLLRADTRVTNHGFADGRATAYQSVLQAGSAVLVDDRGVPRVRCACGNPLTPPRRLSGNARYGGTGWEGFRPSTTIVITPARRAVSTLVIVDVRTDVWIERPLGGQPDADEELPQPPPDPFDPPTPEPEPDDTTESPGDGTESPTDGPTESPGEPTDTPTDGPPAETGEPTDGAPDTPGGAPDEPGGVPEEPGAPERAQPGELAGSASAPGVA